jgi:hypothetical protein
MIAQPSGLGTGVGRFSKPLRGAEVFAIRDAVLGTTRHFESVCKVPQGRGVLQLLVPGVAVGVFIDFRSVTDGVEVTH